MILILTLLSLFNHELLSAQDSIQIITYYDQVYPKRVKEDYWVLSLDTNIKTGPYKEFFRNGTISISGLYQNGKQMGRWYLYDVQTNEPYLIYDFETNEEIIYKPTCEDKKANIDRYPYCPQFLPDSFTGIGMYIINGVENLNLKDRSESRYCKAIIIITITETGKIEADTLFPVSCNENLVVEVIEMIENSPKWYPMIRNGVPEKFSLSFDLIFGKTNDNK